MALASGINTSKNKMVTVFMLVSIVWVFGDARELKFFSEHSPSVNSKQFFCNKKTYRWRMAKYDVIRSGTWPRKLTRAL